MTVEDLIEMLEAHRDMLVLENKIKHPEYDPYINGWDDCIDWLEQHTAEIAKAT